MSAERAAELNSNPICKIVAQTSVAHEPLYFTTAPGKAITKVLDKAGYTINDIDLFEINEAFSNVALAAMREHNIPHEKVNIFGGAVSMLKLMSPKSVRQKHQLGVLEKQRLQIH